MYTTSHVYDIEGLVYDILCDYLCFLVPARAGSNAAPLRLKSGPDPVQMRPGSAVAHPVRLSVFFGLEIGLQWFTNPYKARPPVPPPHPPPPRGPLRRPPLREQHDSDFGADIRVGYWKL